MQTADQQRSASAPATWTGEKVCQRLIEACAIERRMPGESRGTLGSSWPATPVHDFVDMLHWDEGETRTRVWASWANAKGVYAYEVTRMEEAFGWLSWLEEGERRCLHVWAFTSVRKFSLSRILEQKKWSRSTFYRKRDQAADKIAVRLNNRGVTVR